MSAPARPADTTQTLVREQDTVVDLTSPEPAILDKASPPGRSGLAVSAGGLLAGVAGAIVAVPVVAVTDRVADHLAARGERPGVAPAPAEVAT